MSFFFSRQIALALTGLFIIMTSMGSAWADTPISASVAFNSQTGDIHIEFRNDPQHVPSAQWLHRTQASKVYEGQLPAISDTLRTAAWSTSASYIAGNNWLPEGVVTQYDITVIVNATDQVAVTGKILKNQIKDQKRHLRFTFEGPSDQLMILIGQYEVEERQFGDITLRTYFDAQNASLAERYLTATETYISHFENQIGPFPYDSYSVVAAPIPVGLGFAGLTYAGKEILAHEYMSQRSLAHEILHSWLGNAVRVDYATGNWSEGLTTYLADYGIGANGDPAEEAAMRRGWIRKLDALPAQDMSPLRDFVVADHLQNQSEGYGKAAMVFHILRQQLGDPVFFDSLRAFYQKQLGKQAGWDDLRGAFEATSGHNLEAFFVQWVDLAGLPSIAIKSVDTLADGADLTLTQTAPIYELNVPIMIETSTGRDYRSLLMTEMEQSFQITAREPIEAIHVDPDFNMLRRPLAQELAPTLGIAFNTDDFNASVAANTQAEGNKAREIANGMLPDHNLNWEEFTNPELGRLVIGTTEEVAEITKQNFSKLPEFAREGAARAWVDYDNEGRIWFFLSGNDLDELWGEMRFLGYYSMRGFVVFEDRSGKRSGTPLSQFSPLFVRLQ